MLYYDKMHHKGLEIHDESNRITPGCCLAEKGIDWGKYEIYQP